MHSIDFDGQGASLQSEGVENASCSELMEQAAKLRDEGFGVLQTYSPKVFIPLTQLCRDVCSYCTFAHPPRPGESSYLTPEDVLAIARAGAAQGCAEALFTLGDKPELRYRAARDALAALGHDTTLSYLAEMCALVLRETGLLPHVNAGVMGADGIAALRRVSVSQGLMLESSAARLCEPGGPHYGSPDKHPAARLETIRLAGEAQVPFTTGILIGIGETRAERIESLRQLKALHDRYGHIQEVIIQNFRAKAGTRMADFPEPDLADHQWTIAVARLIFGPSMSIQAPPNLRAEPGALVAAGINDWGGISPLTIDHVNPEAPWPHLADLAHDTANAGRTLVPRLGIYPSYLNDLERWLDPALRAPTLRLADSDGLLREGGWSPGQSLAPPALDGSGAPSPQVTTALARLSQHEEPDEAMLVALFSARGPDVARVCAAADALRREAVGDTITYAVNRNINYTNICQYKCSFCAFSKGRGNDALRGTPYDLDMGEVTRRVREAWDRGATEVCMQGGIHPHYTGDTYLRLLEVAKTAAPGIHVHAFSPLEVMHGASTLGLSIGDYLARLKAAGLGSLPGTAAEILDDEVRAQICPDKLGTDEWIAVMEAAHAIGLRTTATIMFGHVERPEHWARHLLRVRALQARTGGFTEFVPLPFVHMEAPMYLRGSARQGPTWRETLLMHAVARLALHPLIPNIQTSWVKLGAEGAAQCLKAGVNDLGGTLMNESISRAAGTTHGQEMEPRAMEALAASLGRPARQRSTLYGPVDAERQLAGRDAAPLAEIVQTAPVPRRSAKSLTAV